MKRLFALTTWACILSVLLSGCYHAVLLTSEERTEAELSRDDIQSVVTTGGKRYDFDTLPRPLVKEGNLIGYVGGRRFEFATSDVKEIYVSKMDVTPTALAVGGGTAGLLLIAWLSSTRFK